MSKQTVNIGLLGSGRIGQMHAKLLQTQVPGARLAMVQDEVGQIAQQVGDELGVAATHDAAELLASPDVDAVAICASTEAHVPLLLQALAASKPVFCEKPVSLDLAEVDKVVEAADATGAAGQAIQIGFNRRFDPSHAHLARAVKAGDIGEVHLLRITSRDPEPPPMEYVNRSGGIFFDMTIHDFDMARFVTGSEVIQVYATGEARITPQLSELGDLDTAVTVLRHENSAITTIDNSRQAVYGYDQRIEAFGSDGMLVSDNVLDHTVTQRDRTGGHAAPVPYFFIERYQASYVAQWEAFVSMANGAPSPVTLADGRAPMLIAEAATQSVKQGRALELAEIC